MSRARIVSLLAAGTEMLYALGLGDRVIAVSHECDYPLDATLKPRLTSTRVNDEAESRQIDQQVNELLAQGAPLYEIDVDRLVLLAPDLIVTQAQCEVCAVSEEALRCALDQRGMLKSIAIVTLNPVSLEGVFEDIRRVGEASGSQDAARTYVTGLRNRVDAIETKRTHYRRTIANGLFAWSGSNRRWRPAVDADAG
jgi:iron complex transport system substrate-binding protein